MRTLLLLRGSAGCGKSTWIEQNKLKNYTLSADDIRLLYQSPIMQVDGTKGISQSNDKLVWETLFKILEARMQKGEFTVIDATNSKTSEMNNYKKLADKYHYRVFCVDFTNIPIEEVKRRNLNRPVFKQVPEEVIDNMYSRFKTQKIPSGIKPINPDELDKIWIKKINLSEYKKIHHIGDIHGCNTVLQEYLKEGIKNDEFYIFVGDYVDRGLENVEVLKFLISIMNKKNVLLLEGNHERHLWDYANDEVACSKEFELVTKQQLIQSDISKKDIRMLYRKLIQCAYYEYQGNTYLVTHGGLSTLPENLTLVATEQMIKGVGHYTDHEKIANTFLKTTSNNVYQIHGHRNVKDLPIKSHERVFNLEGKIEFGGYLRCVQVDENGSYEIEIKNNVFKEHEPVTTEQTLSKYSVSDMVMALRSNKYINEKKFGNISSFNFSHKAFYDKVWDEQTTKARGLYIDIEKRKIAARAYNKFFNINEREETKFENLQSTLQFPVTAYVKENGYLGIVSYDEYNDDLFIATKSTTEGDYANWLKEMLHKKISSENIQKMKEYIKQNDVSFVFECVDMKNDPHIIEYEEDKLILLDIVRNQIEFSKYSYEDLTRIGCDLGISVKERAIVIDNWQEFFDWYHEVLKEDYLYQNRYIEGFVIEDSCGFMTKLKLSYYKFWKHMRWVAEETLKRGYILKTSSLLTPTANEFYAWMKLVYDKKDEYPRDICSLRRLFFEEKKK